MIGVLSIVQEYLLTLYEEGEHYGGQKPGLAQGKPTTIYSLLADLPTWGGSGSQHELDLNSQRSHC